MNKRFATIVCLAGAWLVGFNSTALAADEPAPVAQPAPGALPSGHPDIGQMGQPAQSGMPAGHPDVGQAKQPGAGMPAGHPDVAQMKGGMPGAAPGGMPGAMPPGHPEMLSLPQADAAAKPMEFATVTIRTQQLTPGAAPLSEGKVTVQIFRPNGQAQTVETPLGADGTAVLQGLPAKEPFQPVARITYSGVEYEAVGQIMDATHASQDLVVGVYETTEEAPAWQIKMRHVMVEPAGDVLNIMELLAIENPGDRAWVGVADDTGGRTTFTLPLPPGAANVQLVGGFHDCCTRIEPDGIVNTMALKPGTTQYHFTYTVPVSERSAVLPIVAPAPTSAVLAVVPDDGSTVAAEGMEMSGIKEMKLGPSRIYRGANVAGGQAVKLTIDNVPAAPARAVEGSATSHAAPHAGSGQAAKVIAGVGGLMIFLFGGALLVVRPGKRAKKA